jgi:hypothetical protein
MEFDSFKNLMYEFQIFKNPLPHVSGVYYT